MVQSAVVFKLLTKLIQIKILGKEEVMRIIDKNHDYYDYLQDPTDTLVFDRRNSFILEKSYICDNFYFGRNEIDKLFIRLQCGATFWIFLATATKFEKREYINAEKPTDFDLELIATWKDYNKPNKLLDINLASIGTRFSSYDWKARNYEFKRDKVTPEAAIGYFDSLDSRNLTNVSTLRRTIDTKNGWEAKFYTIPLLCASGIADIISPIDIFCAIEEYFSIEKSSVEKTEPMGATNDDKIIMHGFDTKTSFRGKR